jgi:alpha-amylase
MVDLVLLFEVHQPLRIKPLTDLPPGSKADDPLELLNWELNKVVFDRVAENVYIKASRILLEALREVEDFKVTFSISGLALELMEKWAPQALELLREIASTGRAEFMAQTYYHSLAWFIDVDEFVEQVQAQARLVEELLGYRPSAAENTEFIYNNDVACTLYSIGFKVTVTEGVEWIPGFKGPNYVYQAYGCPARVLTRNYRLSDDIGFRFSLRTWDQYPLTADKYASWVARSPGDVVLVALDYETFGEHQRPETGIYDFLRWLPREAVRAGLSFATVTEAAFKHRPRGALDVPPWATISWADERDVSAWLGNEAQRIGLEVLRMLYNYAKALGGEALRVWRLYTLSDHFYYQATKTGPAGEVHSYFNPYTSPYKAQLIYHMALKTLRDYIVRMARADYCRFIEVFRAPRRLCYHIALDSGVLEVCSYTELLEALRNLPEGVVREHITRGYIDRWVDEVLLAEGGLDYVRSRCSGAPPHSI